MALVACLTKQKYHTLSLVVFCGFSIDILELLQLFPISLDSRAAQNVSQGLTDSYTVPFLTFCASEIHRQTNCHSQRSDSQSGQCKNNRSLGMSDKRQCPCPESAQSQALAPASLFPCDATHFRREPNDARFLGKEARTAGVWRQMRQGSWRSPLPHFPPWTLAAFFRLPSLKIQRAGQSKRYLAD